MIYLISCKGKCYATIDLSKFDFESVDIIMGFLNCYGKYSGNNTFMLHKCDYVELAPFLISKINNNGGI